jgi:hypothetical protein
MANEAKTRQVQPENNLEALFDAANRDSVLKRRLLANPEKVAEEWKVTLSDQDLKQLTDIRVLAESAEDVNFGYCMES